MITSDLGVAELERRESVRTAMYRDSAGIPTIGVGHRLTTDELSSGKVLLGEVPVPWHQGLSEDQVNELLRQDLAVAQRAVNSLVHVLLSQSQFDALVSFVFNIGSGAFAGSTLLKRLNSGDYGAVPLELKRWIHSAGQVNPILITRREAEIIQWNAAA